MKIYLYVLQFCDNSLLLWCISFLYDESFCRINYLCRMIFHNIPSNCSQYTLSTIAGVNNFLIYRRDKSRLFFDYQFVVIVEKGYHHFVEITSWSGWIFLSIQIKLIRDIDKFSSCGKFYKLRNLDFICSLVWVCRRLPIFFQNLSDWKNQIY